MPQVRQRDVVWLRPACRPGDGRRPQVQTLPLPPEAFLCGADIRRSQVICRVPL